MKEIKIENITLSLSSEDDKVRVTSKKEDVILSNQNIDIVSELIKRNFDIVYNHYKMMGENKEFDFNDIAIISISIVLHYLYMYNSWRSMYKNQENRNLRFSEKDFNNPSTHDIMFNYFKTKYPIDWEERCSILLGMKSGELKAYYKTREDFYNK